MSLSLSLSLLQAAAAPGRRRRLQPFQVAMDLGVVHARGHVLERALPQRRAQRQLRGRHACQRLQRIGGAQVLGHQRQGEAAVVGAGHDELPQLGFGGHIAAAGGVEYFGENVQVQIHAAGDQQRLAGSQQASRVDVVVQRLHGVRGAHGACVDERGAHAREQGAHALQAVFVGAHHDGQRAGGRLGHRARYGRVDERNAGFTQERSQAQRLGGVGRPHVQQHGTGAHHARQSGFALDHCIGDGAIGQHGNDYVAIGQRLQAGGRL
jgi:hypothetical protein